MNPEGLLSRTGAVSPDRLARQVRRMYDMAPDASFESLSEPLATWVSYAMDTVKRGRDVFEELRPHGLRSGFRFLDAGCAYGGALAAAAEFGAREIVGIDHDEKLVSIARDLLSSAGLPVRIEAGSLSDLELFAGLGTFDVITCADVVEHVDDAAKTINHLARALAPGGLLYLATPNPRNPAWVLRDPHFQIFGITLLPPPLAREYARVVLGHNFYDIGDFGSLAGYRSLLEREGLSVELINAPVDAAAGLRQLHAELDALEAETDRFADDRLAPELEREVRGRARGLATELRARLLSAEGGHRRWWSRRRGGESREIARVVAEYGVQTWHLLGRRA